jgi:hypothetical protein
MRARFRQAQIPLLGGPRRSKALSAVNARHLCGAKIQAAVTGRADKQILISDRQFGLRCNSGLLENAFMDFEKFQSKMFADCKEKSVATRSQS